MISATLDNANLGAYSAPEVVTIYAGLDYLMVAEQLLFETYLKQGISVLDLGVGGGRTTSYLSRIAATYVGVDYSEEMIRACRARFPELRFEVQDAADLALFTDESFDAIVFSFNGIDSLVPSAKRERCLQECYRVLKHGGTFIFSCHNPRSIVVGWDWDWDALRVRAEKMSGDRGKLFCGTVLAGLCCAKLGLTVCRAGIRSVPRALRRLRTKTYWRGEGYHFDSIHGGLWMHHASPRHVIEELSKVQFKFLQIVPEDHPRKARSWRTRWYYYAFAKP